MKQEETERKIQELLIRRAPNWVSELTLRQRLDVAADEDLEAALESLVVSGAVIREIDNQGALNRPRQYFKLASYKSVPVRETIRVGDIEVPRVLSTAGVIYAPENINEAIEGLADQSAAMEKRFQEAVEEQHTRYWANIVGLFGVFASVIALVVSGLPNLELHADLPFWKAFIANFAVLLPIALVLGLFVVFVRWVVK